MQSARLLFRLAAVFISSALISSCGGGGSTPVSPQPNALTPAKLSNARYGCAGPVAPGHVRCFVIIRTDIGGGNPKGYHGLYKTKAGVKASAAPAIVPSGFGPSDLQSAYNLTTLAANNGSGQTIAIVDAFDDPNAESDLATYRSQFGLPACTTANGCFQKLNQDGQAQPLPSNDLGWEVEESLDVDMVSAICPKCHIMLVEANDDFGNNLAAAVDTAASLGANVISNSYGGTEFVAADPNYDHPGHVITASTGDNGWSFGVTNPASYSTVVAVGGTSLTKSSSSRGWTETAWSGAGSGCSQFVTKPSWQNDSDCQKRTEADVSAVADPNTGVAVYDSGNGGWLLAGGTSASSPIVAAVYGLAGASATQNAAQGIWLDAGAHLFDVTSGNNGNCVGYICNAGTGYDGPTGWGTPNGITAFGAKLNSTTTIIVNDTGTNAPWSGTETALASADATATVSAANGPTSTTPTGNVSFAFYTAGSCAGTPFSTQTVTLHNGSATSDATGALQPGSYAYQAAYPGDTNYAKSASACAPFTVHPCAFSSLSANLDVTTHPEFALHANFAPGTGCKSPIALGAQQVAIAVGSYSITLPPGSLVLQKNGSYVFKGTLSGGSVNIKFTPRTGGYVLDETVGSVTPAQSNPVPVTLTIGNTTGSTSVNATFGH